MALDCIQVRTGKAERDACLLAEGQDLVDVLAHAQPEAVAAPDSPSAASPAVDASSAGAERLLVHSLLPAHDTRSYSTP